MVTLTLIVALIGWFSAIKMLEKQREPKVQKEIFPYDSRTDPLVHEAHRKINLLADYMGVYFKLTEAQYIPMSVRIELKPAPKSEKEGVEK